MEIFNEKVQNSKANLIIKIQNIILFNAFFNLYPTIKHNVEYEVK